MALYGHPSSIVIDADGGNKFYTLINAGMTDLIYKIRSSNNSDYRFRNVYGLVKGGSTTTIEVIRSKAPPKADRFIIQYAIAPVNVNDPQQACADFKPIGGITKAPPKADRFIIQYAIAPVNVNDPQQACADFKPIGGITVGLYAIP
ncbi:MSP domain protein [Dictyocaulus viviparus]|uniref:Major sperm protein n=1 Tax=Dictyocaulus viviparus TaxID=29172 RepID=A0A0D8Y0P0_DICVI|nr:MSP domain protein [Dictyocaulus viviparus]